MSWAESLIKLSTYEVEVIQKRMAEIADRRMAAQDYRTRLDREGEAEAERARTDPDAAWSHAAYAQGLRLKKAEADAEIARIAVEEQGVRDALATAFEAQKKYEHVAEAARLKARLKEDRIETAMLDELGLRRTAVR